MGGRGSRAAAGRGIGLGGGFGALGGFGAGAAVPPPQVVPGQPVPAVTQQQLQAMTDAEFANYLNGLKSTPSDPLTYYNSDWDTQRLIANMPELNLAPDVVDPKTFASLPGETLYRTVNATGTQSAVDICGRTMASDVTTIGSGRMGDGFYFANNKRTSQVGYGNTMNNINKTATMQAKLNGNAKVIGEMTLGSMFATESQTVRNAVLGMKSDGQWAHSGWSAYVLRKGYNVVRGHGGVLDIIDRRAATWSGEIIPYT